VERRSQLRRVPLAPMSPKRARMLAEAGIPAVSTFAGVHRGGKVSFGRPVSTGPARGVVDLILERDGYACVRCGDGIGDLRGIDWSIQHRVARGAGGTCRPELNLAANLITLCGSATSEGCHHEVEQRGVEDRLAGYWLLRDTAGAPTDPATWPIHHAGLGWILLDNAGRWTRFEVSA